MSFSIIVINTALFPCDVMYREPSSQGNDDGFY